MNDGEIVVAMAVDTWSSLEDAGISAGTLISIEYFFVDGDEAGALALHAALRQASSQVEIEASRRGVFKRRKVWSVTGMTKPLAVSYHALVRWVEVMVRLGEWHGVEFERLAVNVVTGIIPPAAGVGLDGLGGLLQELEESGVAVPRVAPQVNGIDDTAGSDRD